MLKGYRVKKNSREVIEPEEIFVDSHLQKNSDDELLLGHKMESPVAKKAIVFFLALGGLVFLTIWARVFQLQFLEGAKYKALAQNNQFYLVPILAPRGLIYDQNKKILAQNKAAYALLLNFRSLGANREQREAKISELRKLVSPDKDMGEDQLRGLIENPPNEAVMIKTELGHEEMLSLDAKKEEFPGLLIQESSRRYYPFGEEIGHLLGYLGRITEKEKEIYPHYFLTEKVGKSGLEFSYESFLRGQPGYKKYFFNGENGNNEDLSYEEKSKSGNSLILNLDLGLQRKLYASLNSAYVAQRKQDREVEGASAVVIDPRNGAVRAMVSLPSFDDNKFSIGLTEQDVANLFNNETKPLFNRAIAGQYPSGSAIKPIMASAALEEKIITPTKQIDDLHGVLTVSSPFDPSVTYSFRDWAVHGVVDLYSAIAKSCNIYFYEIGGGYKDQLGLGIERISKYFLKFGLGKKTNIDLPGEQEGLVPTPQWKKETKNDQWYIGDTYHVSIGQGGFLATPLQMVSAIAAIANGGKIYQPRVVDKIVDSEENIINEFKPKILAENIINDVNLAEIRKAMRQTVTDGSARQMSSLPVAVAGKTGTAQTGKGTLTHAWFVGFAPYEKPELAIVVMVENAGEGHAVAVPVAQDVLGWYFSSH